ncbi:MAG TPA: asparagine synthase (glutamine-hydrolyzing) [Chitinophagaceae bacterium]|nr:asparagine synthase (glutamine-hydrolyzing) [Chitinophagaceae bacterium]
MCGITGIIQINPQLYNKEHLEKMTDALSHRGPDGKGFWHNELGNVLLGHRRLSIIDLTDAAAQPFHYLNRYTTLHNGEIYNYIELRDELKKKGYGFRTQSDTEVLTAAYDCWKEDCLQQLDGMFAFVIWDEKEKQVFAARDRFGEKPFHYIYDDIYKAFLFASEIKAFWTIDIGKEFNKKMLFNFLTIGYTDNPNQPDETFYEGVRKLPPASFLKIELKQNFRIGIEKYWDIEIKNQNENISDEDAIGKFSELFVTSIKRRLRSDVPLGTSLSGGLDSSSIAAAICKLMGDPHQYETQNTKLKVFSATFPGFEKNEEKYIDEIARDFSLQSFKTSIANDEVPILFQKLIQQQDEPFGSAGTLPQYKVFELAKQNGVKVLLDGQGADEILAGYHKYYKWYWQELFRKSKLVSSGEIRKAKELGVDEGFGIRNIIGALFPDFATVFLERQYLLNALRQEDLAREFVNLQSQEAYYTTPAIFSLNGVLYFNTCMHGLEELLKYADRNSMAHGREVRLPFLNHELVEFLFLLPSHFKIREGWTKWTLRKAMENTLPTNIVWRRDKIGLEPPQKSWMQLPPVQEMIHEAKKKLVNEKILKPSVMNKKIKPVAAYEKDNYDWKYLVSAQFL